MASPFSFIPQGGAVPNPSGPVIAPTEGQRMGNAIPLNVAAIVLLSAGALVALDLLRFNFVIGLGSN